MTIKKKKKYSRPLAFEVGTRFRGCFPVLMSTVLELRCLLADILFDSNGRFLPNVKAYIRSTNYILMFVFVEKRHDMSVSFWKRKVGKF